MLYNTLGSFKELYAITIYSWGLQVSNKIEIFPNFLDKHKIDHKLSMVIVELCPSLMAIMSMPSRLESAFPKRFPLIREFLPQSLFGCSVGCHPLCELFSYSYAFAWIL